MRANLPMRTSLLNAILFNTILVVFSTNVLGQNVSPGVIGGASPTGDFQDQRLFDGFSPGITNSSTPKRYVIGASLEFRIRSQFRLEVDGLFHPLGYTFAGLEPDGSLNSISPATVVTWEFPVLAKYRFAFSGVNPFIEAGPSFRTTGNLNSANPSHFGFTAGVGVETHVRSLAIAPVIRYTRWAPSQRFAVPTVADQVELLVGFSSSPQSSWRPLGGRVSVGAVVGTTLTHDFGSQHTQFVSNDANIDIFSGSGSHSFLAGAKVDVQLRGRFSVEVDGISESLKGTSRTTVTGTPSTPTLLPGSFEFSVHEWKFPVLAKYRFEAGRIQPFAELGPSFRTPPGGTSYAHYGVTAGLGVEMRLRRFNIAPALRYTHWGPDQFSGSHERLSQAEFLTGFAF
jgi:hypothetical protein